MYISLNSQPSEPQRKGKRQQNERWIIRSSLAKASCRAFSIQEEGTEGAEVVRSDEAVGGQVGVTLRRVAIRLNVHNSDSSTTRDGEYGG